MRGPARAAPAPPRAQPGPWRRPAAGSPVPARGPTAAAARTRTTGRPARRTPGPQTRHRHRRTAARQQLSQITAARSRNGRAAPPGAVRVAGCQVRRRRATPIARISGNDTMSARAASGECRDRQPARPCSRCRRAPNRTPATRPRPARSPRMTPTRRYVLIEKVAEQLAAASTPTPRPLAHTPAGPVARRGTAAHAARPRPPAGILTHRPDTPRRSPISSTTEGSATCGATPPPPCRFSPPRSGRPALGKIRDRRTRPIVPIRSGAVIGP